VVVSGHLNWKRKALEIILHKQVPIMEGGEKDSSDGKTESWCGVRYWRERSKRRKATTEKKKAAVVEGNEVVKNQKAAMPGNGKMTEKENPFFEEKMPPLH